MKMVITIALALFIAGCSTIGRAISNAHKESNEEARAHSVRDSTLVFGTDTVFYAGRPLYLASDPVLTDRTFITTLAGEKLINIRQYRDYGLTAARPDTLEYLVEVPDLYYNMVVKGTDIPSVVKILYDNKVLVPDGISRSGITRALNAGIIKGLPLPTASSGSSGSAGSGSSSYSTSSGSAGSTPRREVEPQPKSMKYAVNLTLRNSCHNTVPIFWGESPGYSSGTFSSASGNAISSETGHSPGDLLWIVDANRNPVTKIAIEADTKEIEITSDGKSFRRVR
ncbi:MAG: hypothetical protein JWQ98_3615 [Chlorobi bacterium]|nr:hypothetical protein [Chlorobiota bacterium]